MVSPVSRLFLTTWQEDIEIQFLDTADRGIPPSSKDHRGVPVESQQVRDYIRRLFLANRLPLLSMASDAFIDLMGEFATGELRGISNGTVNSHS